MSQHLVITETELEALIARTAAHAVAQATAQMEMQAAMNRAQQIPVPESVTRNDFMAADSELKRRMAPEAEDETPQDPGSSSSSQLPRAPTPKMLMRRPRPPPPAPSHRVQPNPLDQPQQQSYRQWENEPAPPPMPGSLPTIQDETYAPSFTTGGNRWTRADEETIVFPRNVSSLPQWGKAIMETGKCKDMTYLEAYNNEGYRGWVIHHGKTCSAPIRDFRAFCILMNRQQRNR